MNLKKRIISLLLCFLLLLGNVLPAAALDSSEPACSGSCEDTSSAATHNAQCAIYAYYESMSAKGAQHIYENWNGIAQADQENLIIWLQAHNPATAAELDALLNPQPVETTAPAETTAPIETTAPAETQPVVEEKTLESGEFSVTGKDIPEGAELIIGEFPMPYSADTPAVSMYNIKVYDGDEVWQPANGETVEVSIPVSNSDAETVNVVHFMEDPDKIRYALDNGTANIYDLSQLPEDAQYIFEDALYGYQTAANTADLAVVYELFENCVIVDGKVNISSNGFSIFVEDSTSDTGYSETFDSFSSLNGKTVYVRPGEWMEFSAFTILGSGFQEYDSSGIVEKIDEGDGWLFSTDSIYFHVSDDAVPDQTFTIRCYYFLYEYYEVKFVVVPDFDYGNVRIGVVSHTGEYPNEIKTHDDADVDYFYANDKLNTGNTIYGTAPRAVVDIDALMDSSSFVANDRQTAYGISDVTGVATTVFLKDTFSTIAADILTEYCDANGLDEDSYELIVYVIKYEAVGNNVGWYINCKVELKSNFVLSYDYNPPAGFTEFHIGTQKKPDAQSIPTNGQESVTATVGVGTGMILSTTIDGKTEEATFVGWSRDPNATATDTLIEDGADITITEDTVLYAIWEVSYHYEDASISFQNTVQDPQGNAVTNDTTEFSFTASGGAGFNGLTYTIYNANGTQASTGKFAAAAPTFTLTNGQFIVIEGVVNSSSDYIITEAVPDGYSAQNNGVTTISINTDTNKTGVFSRELVNTRLTYSLTYTGIGVTESTEDVAIGSTVTVAAAPNRNGYDFVGWSDGSNTYQAGNTFTMPAQNVTLTAQWTPTNYTITYNGLDGAIVSGNPATYTIESDAITLNNPTKEGYTFDGWSGTDITGLSKSVTIPAGSIGDRTYTANWTRITYPVTYNTNGGTGTLEDQTKVYGVDLSLHSNVPTKEGYSFSGWLGSDNSAYAAGAIYTGNAALTLTAQWTALYKYTLTFDDNVTDDSVSNMPEGYCSTVWEEAASKTHSWTAVPNRPGYDFQGWSTSATAASGEVDTSYTITGTGAGTASVTLYAIWKINTYMATFDPANGDGSSSANFNVTTALALPTVTRPGYAFQGWKVTAVNSDPANWTEGDIYSDVAVPAGKYGNVVLTAQWEAILGDLTIRTTLSASAPYADQNFVFVVTGDPDDENIGAITIEVALDGNDEVVIGNMPAGTYTVTEKGNWTWRYKDSKSETVQVTAEGGSVTFDFGQPDILTWLSGYHYGKN